MRCFQLSASAPNPEEVNNGTKNIDAKMANLLSHARKILLKVGVRSNRSNISSHDGIKKRFLRYLYIMHSKSKFLESFAKSLFGLLATNLITLAKFTEVLVDFDLPRCPIVIEIFEFMLWIELCSRNFEE